MRTKTLKVLRITMPVIATLDSCASPSPMVAQPSRSKPAVDEVFEIYELLESILLQLPMRDLLLAQRVCHRWQSVIGTSQRLQRSLYLLPSPVVPGAAPSTLQTNPLLIDVFRPFFNYAYFRGKVNIWHIISPTSGRYGIEILLKPTTEKFQERMRYQEASWRRMLLTQPPVTHILTTDWRIAPDYDDCFNYNVENLQGVRMADFLVLDDPAIAESA